MADEQEESAQLLIQYKILVAELETQVQILHETLKEKEFQLNQFKTDCEETLNELKTKSDRVVDLEFELLSVNQGLNSINMLEHSREKSDNGTEKCCTFWVEQVEEKTREIDKLESELRKRTCDLQGVVNKELWEKNRQIEKLQNRFGIIVEGKDQEIIKLEKHVSARDLQLKVLKDKINELGIHVNLPSDAISTSELFDLDSTTAPQVKILEEQLQVCLEERKFFLQKIEELQLQQRTTPEHEEGKELQQLRIEYDDLHEELEKSEKLRQESSEICSILSTRLEELCYFLDSLLKQKSVLGFLGNKQTSKLRDIVDQSLNLSHTLSETFALNADQSLLQLSNISNLLNATRNSSILNLLPQEEENSTLSIIPADVILTYQSHLTPNTQQNADNDVVAKQAQVINVLRQQNDNLKREIEVRDVELGRKLTAIVSPTEKVVSNDQELVSVLMDLQAKPVSEGTKSPQTILQTLMESRLTSPTLMTEKSVLNTTSTTLKNQNTENQSESESWSEPDRTVSFARIGLVDESLKRPNPNLSRRNRFITVSAMSTESTEDEESLCAPSRRSASLVENRQTLLSLHEELTEAKHKLQQKENELLAAQAAYYEVDNLLKDEKAKREELAKNYEDLAEKIKQTEGKLCNAEKTREDAEKKLLELKEIVISFEDIQGRLQKEMLVKDKQMQNLVNELEIEKQKTVNATRNVEKIAEQAQADVVSAETKLQNMQVELQQLESRLCKKYGNEYENKFKQAEEQFLIKVQTIERNCTVQIKKIKECMNNLKCMYEKDYIKKSDVEMHTSEMETIIKELNNLKQIVKVADNKMQEMESKEVELKCKLGEMEQEYYEKVNALRKDLDHVTLEHSEMMLEKSKIISEKLILEEEVNNLHKQTHEFKMEFVTLKQNFQKQFSYMESKKSDLETKVSELECANAELRNRLIRMQNGYGFEQVSAASLPNSPSKVKDLFVNRSLPVPIQGGIPYRWQSSVNSGYTSEEIPEGEEISNTKGKSKTHLRTPLNILATFDIEERQQENASPDLGIESDQGRFSSLEANVNVARPLLPTLELTKSMSNLLDVENYPIQDINCEGDQCCKKAEQMANENVDLRKRLLRTRRALEETVTQLTLANKRKKEVEKSICKQIHNTSQVLRKAKANLDSGSETEIRKN